MCKYVSIYLTSTLHLYILCKSTCIRKSVQAFVCPQYTHACTKSYTFDTYIHVIYLLEVLIGTNSWTFLSPVQYSRDTEKVDKGERSGYGGVSSNPITRSPRRRVEV